MKKEKVGGQKSNPVE